MQATDVIVVNVRCDRDERLIHQVGDFVSERRNAKTRIDQQVGVAPPQMPDVAAKERVNERFPQQRQR